MLCLLESSVEEGAASKLSRIFGRVNFMVLGIMHLASLKPRKERDRGRGEWEKGWKKGFRGKVLWHYPLLERGYHVLI